MSGPDREAANRQGDEVYEKVIALLKEQYHVDEPIQMSPLGFSAKLKEDWQDACDRLRESLRDLVWVEHCQSW